MCQVPPYLRRVDAVVDGPNGLEVVLHLLLKRLGYGVHRGELLQVTPLRVVLRSEGNDSWNLY